MRIVKRIITFTLLIASVAWPALPTFGAISGPTQTVPKVTLKWLSALSLSPQTAKAGQTITGTVVLLRNAIENLTVSLHINGAQVNEIGVQVINNVMAPIRVVIPAGSDRSTFQIQTTANIKYTGNKTYQITASLGTESLSQTFTVSNSLR